MCCDDNTLMDALRDNWADIQYHRAWTHPYWVGFRTDSRSVLFNVTGEGDTLDDAIRNALKAMDDLDE